MAKCRNLDQVRKNIDKIDNQLISLIAERGKYVKQAATFKASEEGVKASDRVEHVISCAKEKAKQVNADENVVETVYRAMINAFIEAEMNEYKRKSTEK